MKRAILCAATLTVLAFVSAGQSEKPPVQMTAGNLVFTQSDAGPKLIVIYGDKQEMLVEIHRDGSMKFGKHYKPDAAARVFWKAIERDMPPCVKEPKP